MRDEEIRAYTKVSCPCGNAVRIDPLSEERSLRCPKCAYLIDFVVSVDRVTKRPRVSIVVPREAIQGDGESLAIPSATRMTPPPPPPAQPPRARTVVRGVFGTCICGEEFPVDDHELTTIQPCPRCGIKYHVVVKMERDTKFRSAILVPVDGAPPSKPRVAHTAVPLKGTKVPKRTRVTNAPTKARTKGPSPIPPGAQAVVCPCGETLVARKKDVEAGLTCGACGNALRLMEDRNPQTLAPRIRLRPDPKK